VRELGEDLIPDFVNSRSTALRESISADRRSISLAHSCWTSFVANPLWRTKTPTPTRG
jgi:hypothetical protein